MFIKAYWLNTQQVRWNFPDPEPTSSPWNSNPMPEWQGSPSTSQMRSKTQRVARCG